MTAKSYRAFGLPFFGLLLLSILALYGFLKMHRGTMHSLNADLLIPPNELPVLQKAANAGDSGAAMKLYDHFALGLEDQAGAEPWLRRAAQLHDPQAERTLAYFIKDYGDNFQGFGSSPQQSVKSLLEDSTRSTGQANYELASAYAEGYFGKPDFVNARKYFEHGAEMGYRICWTELAKSLDNGAGGETNYPLAYYWISLEAQCVDPRSIGGKETWDLRNKIAKKLTLAQLEQQWQRIDEYIGKVRSNSIQVDEAPFLAGMIEPTDTEQGRILADKAEVEHRAALRQLLRQ